MPGITNATSPHLTAGFSLLQGENAWVFVSEDCIADSVKAYHEFEKKLLEKYPKEKRKDMHPTSISGKHPALPGVLYPTRTHPADQHFLNDACCFLLILCPCLSGLL